MLANHEETNGCRKAVTTVTVTRNSPEPVPRDNVTVTHNSAGSMPRNNVTFICNKQTPLAPGNNVTVIHNKSPTVDRSSYFEIPPADYDEPVRENVTIVCNSPATSGHSTSPPDVVNTQSAVTALHNDVRCNGVHEVNGDEEEREEEERREAEEEGDDFLAPLPTQTRLMRNRSPDPPTHPPEVVRRPEEAEERRVTNLPVTCQLPTEFREHFHLNLNLNSGAPAGGVEESSTFAGRRDVTDPRSLQEREIVSSRGTVRGFKNRVRAGIATFIESPTSDKAIVDEDLLRNYRLAEKGKIVVYSTSMAVVRNTYENCRLVKKILQNHMVRYEERDLYMSRDNQKELKERLGRDRVTVPQVFADGIHLGGACELEAVNECGELRNLLQNFPRIQVRIMCQKCGGYRYVPCSVCHGSKKSVHRNHFTEEFCALRCMQCDENGLQRCDLCLDQQE